MMLLIAIILNMKVKEIRTKLYQLKIYIKDLYSYLRFIIR